MTATAQADVAEIARLHLGSARLTLEEVATLVHCSRAELNRDIEEGRGPKVVTTRGGHRKVRICDLIRWLGLDEPVMEPDGDPNGGNPIPLHGARRDGVDFARRRSADVPLFPTASPIYGRLRRAA